MSNSQNDILRIKISRILPLFSHVLWNLRFVFVLICLWCYYRYIIISTALKKCKKGYDQNCLNYSGTRFLSKWQDHICWRSMFSTCSLKFSSYIDIPYSYLISRFSWDSISRSFIFAISMGESDKRSLNVAKALWTSFYFQKKSLSYNNSNQTGTS